MSRVNPDVVPRDPLGGHPVIRVAFSEAHARIPSDRIETLNFTLLACTQGRGNGAAAPTPEST